MNRLNLVWVQIEGYGGGMALPQKDMRLPFTPPMAPCIRFTNLVCGWVSTIGSVCGMLMGLTPTLLLKDHVSKGKQADESRFTLPHQPITRILRDRGYQVEGLSGIICFREQIPFFMESHRGLRPEMLGRTSPFGATQAKGKPAWRRVKVRNEPDGFPFFPLSQIDGEAPFLADEANIERIYNLAHELDNAAPKALFMHLSSDEKLPELMTALASVGITTDNSLFVMLGDHGYPGGSSVHCGVGCPMPTHDDSMDEYNLRISGAISFPGCQAEEFEKPCISWDLAPTVLDILGIEPQAVLSRTTGINLAPWLRREDMDFPARILRVENRYIGQMIKRAVCLLNTDWRYIIRPGHSYEHYAYLPHTLPGREELYRRDDLEGDYNHVFSPKHRPVVEAFRREFSRTESEIVGTMFKDDCYAYPPLKDALDRPVRPDKRSSKFGEPFAGPDRVFSGLLCLLRAELSRLGVQRALLYGAGEHALDLMRHPEFAGIPVVGLVDDAPQTQSLGGLPVCRPEQAASIGYDAVILGSHRYEQVLYLRCLEWKSPGARILSAYRGPLDDADPLLTAPDAEVASLLRAHPCVVYAAGGRGQDFLNRPDFQELGLTVRAFLDSSPEKHGREINGLPVYCYFKLSAEQLLELDFQSFIIATDTFDEIMSFLSVWDAFGKRFFQLAPSLRVDPAIRYEPWAWRPQPRQRAVRRDDERIGAAWRNILNQFPRALYGQPLKK